MATLVPSSAVSEGTALATAARESGGSPRGHPTSAAPQGACLHPRLPQQTLTLTIQVTIAVKLIVGSWSRGKKKETGISDKKRGASGDGGVLTWGRGVSAHPPCRWEASRSSARGARAGSAGCPRPAAPGRRCRRSVRWLLQGTAAARGFAARPLARQGCGKARTSPLWGRGMVASAPATGLGDVPREGVPDSRMHLGRRSLHLGPPVARSWQVRVPAPART